MKRYFAILSLLSVFMLISCKGETEQTVLRQAVVNADSTYQLAVLASIPFVQNKVPGVTLTDKQIRLLKTVGNVIAAELLTATTTISKGGELSQLTVNTITTSVQAYVKCLQNLKSTSKMSPDCLLKDMVGD